jgi:hypothetical protein
MITLLGGVFFALVIFMIMNASNKNRRYNHRERFREKQEELLACLKENKREEQNVEVCDATGDL